MNDRWSRLRALVESAVGLDESERNDWLAAECDGDPELLDEARALIDAALEDTGFLEPAVRRAPALTEGDSIGPYRLVRRLASGGMGTVYLAERDEPRRRVALKLMRTGLHGPDAASRFRYEVEVLAKLAHPHIAAMYETGVHAEDGLELPWFAMEYIEGARSIVEFAREEGLGIDQRLALFTEACDGAQHGHAHGILHRDLKPENLLVDRDGRVKVIDFGVARATDADLGLTTLRTSTGEIVGTLAYMSPEQVEGDRDALDTRSDVYALGVVLYELLTGELPYDVRGRNTFAAMKTIRDTPPKRPSAVRPSLRGDLETIVLKCLAKDPAQRYDSAAGLAEDLRRFLRREPIAAHPPSVTYQLRVFTRRHRALVVASLAVMVVSVAAAIVSLTWAVRADRSERIATREKEVASEMFETLLTRSTDTNRRFVPRLMELSGASPIVLEMTNANMADLKALEAIAVGDPRVRREIAAAYLRLGAIQGDPDSATHLGDLDATIRAYERAVRIARDLLDARPGDDDAIYFYAVALTSLGYAEAHSGEHDAARSKLETAESMLAGYVRRHPDRRRAVGTLAKTHVRLSHVARFLNDAEAYRRHTKRAVEIREAAVARWPDDSDAQLHLAMSHGQMGNLHRADRNTAAALASYEAAAALAGKLLPGDPDNVLIRQTLAASLLQAGSIDSHSGRPARGTERVQRALDLLVELRDEDPENRQLSMNLILARYSLAGACEMQAAAETDAGVRRHLLARARETYKTILTDAEGGGHAGSIAKVRQRYEELCAELDGD